MWPANVSLELCSIENLMDTTAVPTLYFHFRHDKNISALSNSQDRYQSDISTLWGIHSSITSLAVWSVRKATSRNIKQTVNNSQQQQFGICSVPLMYWSVNHSLYTAEALRQNELLFIRAFILKILAELIRFFFLPISDPLPTLILNLDSPITYNVNSNLFLNYLYCIKSITKSIWFAKHKLLNAYLTATSICCRNIFQYRLFL